MLRLKVPENISLNWQLWHGFGKREVGITGVALGISIPCAVAYAQMSQNTLAPLFAVSGVVLVAFVTGLMVEKFEYNLSIISVFALKIRFRHEQQEYYFKNQEVLSLYVQTEAKTKSKTAHRTGVYQRRGDRK